MADWLKPAQSSTTCYGSSCLSMRKRGQFCRPPTEKQVKAVKGGGTQARREDQPTPFSTFTGLGRVGSQKSQGWDRPGAGRQGHKTASPASPVSLWGRAQANNVPLTLLLPPCGHHCNTATLPPEMTESYFWTDFRFLSFDISAHVGFNSAKNYRQPVMISCTF